MRISTALLCDAATVREGLLHILGGGVSVMGRADFPAPMLVQLAILIHQDPTELGQEHVLDVVVQNIDGVRVAEASVQWLTSSAAVPGFRELAQPLVLPLQDIGLPEPGAYSVELLINGHHEASIGFEVVSGPPAG